MTRAGTERWSLEVVDGWESRDDPECLTIVRPADVGALQISGAVKKGGPVTEDDLTSILKRNPPAASALPCTLGDFVGVYQAYSQEGSWWRRWFLRNADLTLLITYNCAAHEAGVEDDDVDHMLRTLRIES